MKLSLRGRVLTIFSAIMLTVMIAGGLVLLSNAQEAIKLETTASRDLTRKLAIAAIGLLVRGNQTNSILADLPIQIQHPRHVRVHVLDLHGEVVTPAAGNTQPQVNKATPPPKWFYELIRPPIEIIGIPIIKNLRPVGTVAITTEPSDEIAEVWDDFLSLFIVMLTGYAFLLIAIYWALGHALKPLATISSGLEQLESGNYSIELPPISVPDLNQIGVRFNALAAQLDRTTRDKETLSQKLITVQDNERKNIALELHDEFGPCLFGIKVDASYIETNAVSALNGKGTEIAERAGAILKIVDHIQKHNRALLYRLRPMAIGHFGLAQLLDQLVNDFRNRYTQAEWLIDVPEELTTGGETFDLTIYRMIQECLTNAARHSDAQKVHVQVHLIAPKQDPSAPTALSVTVSDDGRGISADDTPGLGLSGMAQRVQGLGGKFNIQSRSGGGTSITARIPFTPQEQNKFSPADDLDIGEHTL